MSPSLSSFGMGHAHTHIPRDPQKTHAYLVGAGIASLSAAVFLIQDAQVPPSQIHILESAALSGGSMDGAGSPETGYILRGGRMLNFSYLNLYDLLARIPSLATPKASVMDEILNFNAVEGNKTRANARIVSEQQRGAEADNVILTFANARKFGLSVKNRIELVKMTLQGEKNLGDRRIEDYFDDKFFKSNFWYMWATMFAFQPWHSAAEFRRYLHRFIHELPRIDTLSGVDRTPFNQYDSIILPITRYLEKEGVDFRFDTKVTDLTYAEGSNITVELIHITESGITGVINIHRDDIVAITLGSMTASSALGNNTTPPSPADSDGSWELWETLARGKPNFGNPSNFSTRTNESTWESFTVTLKSPEFFDRLIKLTRNLPGTGALSTFKDSSWLISIVVPHQPHFIDQPSDVQVFWGYALSGTREGNFVRKAMADCSGAEILTELLGHLKFPAEGILEHAITIPCVMPYITSQFLTRKPGDRPDVIPHGSTNLALMGQFVEIPLDTVFTVEYSVRGALLAVGGLMGLDKQPKKIYKGEHDPRVLAHALEVMLADGVEDTDLIYQRPHLGEAPWEKLLG